MCGTVCQPAISNHALNARRPTGRRSVTERSVMTIPTYLPYYVLFGSIAVIVAVLLGVRNALANSDWPEKDRIAAFRWSVVVLVGWFLFALALGFAGAYQAGAERVPTIQYGITI